MTKQVNFSLPDEDYDALAKLAKNEDRHVYEQARHMIKGALRNRVAPTPLQFSWEKDGENSLPLTTNEARQEPIPG